MCVPGGVGGVIDVFWKKKIFFNACDGVLSFFCVCMDGGTGWLTSRGTRQRNSCFWKNIYIFFLYICVVGLFFLQGGG